MMLNHRAQNEWNFRSLISNSNPLVTVQFCKLIGQEVLRKQSQSASPTYLQRTTFMNHVLTIRHTNNFFSVLKPGDVFTLVSPFPLPDDECEAAKGLHRESKREEDNDEDGGFYPQTGAKAKQQDLLRFIN
jgi:hypothetical protein